MYICVEAINKVSKMVIPKLHKMRLNHSPYLKIKSGVKTIELRLYDEKRQKVGGGDFIEFSDTDTGENLIVQVKDLHRFSSFKDLYNALPADKFGYSADEEANPDDMLSYYSLEEQIKYGVVGIEIIFCENQGNIKLYFNQIALLDTFLEHHAISQAQYDKSLHDLTEKMNVTELR